MSVNEKNEAPIHHLTLNMVLDLFTDLPPCSGADKEAARCLPELAIGDTFRFDIGGEDHEEDIGRIVRKGPDVFIVSAWPSL